MFLCGAARRSSPAAASPCSMSNGAAAPPRKPRHASRRGNSVIDHVSVGVRSLGEAERFYEAVLGALGYAKLVMRSATIGFGRRYAEFWINLRPAMAGDRDGGAHVCLRARSQDEVHRFHAAALAHGGADDGAPARASTTTRGASTTRPSSATRTAIASKRFASSRGDQRR